MSVPIRATPVAVPTRARVIAARLAGLFEADQKIVVALNDAHRLLAAANDQLRTDPVVDRLSVHGQIHRPFCAYQHASEQRRQLAVDVGELSQQLTDAPAPAITTNTPGQPTSTSSPLAAGNQPRKKRRTNDERSREDPGARSVGRGARPRAAPPSDPSTGSGPWRPKPCASSRPRSRTSPRSWKPR